MDIFRWLTAHKNSYCFATFFMIYPLWTFILYSSFVTLSIMYAIILRFFLINAFWHCMMCLYFSWFQRVLRAKLAYLKIPNCPSISTCLSFWFSLLLIVPQALNRSLSQYSQFSYDFDRLKLVSIICYIPIFLQTRTNRVLDNTCLWFLLSVTLSTWVRKKIMGSNVTSIC